MLRLVGLCLLCLMTGCLRFDPPQLGPDPDPDPSIVRTDSSNPNTANGIAFERGVVELNGVRTLVVPESADVEVVSDLNNKVEVLIKKELSYWGHPPPESPVTIAESRNKMGCAVARDGSKIELASYGDWSCIEGGRWVELSIRVPSSITIQREANLSGDDSLPDKGLEDNDRSWEDLQRNGWKSQGRYWKPVQSIAAIGSARKYRLGLTKATKSSDSE